MIREATMHDVPQLVEMGRAFMASTAYGGHIAQNDAQMAALAAQLIDSGTGTVFVSERDGQVTGMLGALVYPHHISGEPILGEVFWWVNPGARGTAGIRLLKAVEQWGKAHGAVKVQMIAPTPQVAAMYTALGYAPVETTFQRSL